MEETNYDRKHHSNADQDTPEKLKAAADLQPELDNSNGPTDSKKTDTENVRSLNTTDYEAGEVQWPRKTFRDKLSLRDNPRPNRLINIMIAPFKGFTYPSVVYAG